MNAFPKRGTYYGLATNPNISDSPNTQQFLVSKRPLQKVILIWPIFPPLLSVNCPAFLYFKGIIKFHVTSFVIIFKLKESDETARKISKTITIYVWDTNEAQGFPFFTFQKGRKNPWKFIFFLIHSPIHTSNSDQWCTSRNFKKEVLSFTILSVNKFWPFNISANTFI